MIHKPMLTRRFRNLPLAWKLMVPYLVLVILVGSAGAVVVVRSLTTRAQTALNEQLSGRLLEARSTLHDRELYLLESANYAANIQGAAAAVKRHDDTATAKLLSSVLALKADVTLLVVTDRRGVGVSELIRTEDQTTTGTGTEWASYPLVSQLLRKTDGRSAAGLVYLATGPILAVAAPVCSGTTSCQPIGLALAGIPLAAVVAAAQPAGTTLAVYGENNARLASTGAAPSTSPRNLGGGLLRVRTGHADEARETLYGPLELQGHRIGTLALSLPTATAFGSARGTAYRLVVVLLLAMSGVIAIGYLLSRLILGQVRPLVATNRRLGAGDLGARVPVRSDDELGELAAGFNQMAGQLQAAVTTLESRADQSAEEVRRLLLQRTEFFAGLSHEFRTPLAVIRAQADLLLEGPGKRTSAERESLKVVKAASSQALHLVNEVLELSRSEAGHVELMLEQVSLFDVVTALQPTMEGLAAAADLSLAADLPQDLATVWSDRRRVSQILLNLVDNAVKYTPAGGAVEVTLAPGGSSIVLSVSDTGIGIPPDQLDELFTPFHRVKGSATQRGQASTGLGLSLTRQLVDALGGTIGVAARDGGGTTFRVAFPTCQPMQAEEPLAQRNRAALKT